MNGPASITVTPVLVADLLAEGERMPSFVFFSDPDGNTWSLQQLPEVRNPPLP
jgi:hypothetical protein